jgi:hypothetical protein
MDSVSAMTAAGAAAYYTAAGHGPAGILALSPISGREAPNVIDLEERRKSRACRERREV